MKSTRIKRFAAAALLAALALGLEACGEPSIQPQREGAEQDAAMAWFSDDHLQPADPGVQKHPDGSIFYTLRARGYSHWKYKEDGSYDILSETKINTQDSWYGFDREFSSKDTALIVMDPWCDWPDDFLNEYFGRITDQTTLPLAQAAAESGHTVIILTNDPATIPYDTKIHPGLQQLVDAGKAELLYHSDYPQEKFLEYLEGKGIDKLLYTGYCSNMCVQYRELGIAPMALTGKVQLYFIPECSAAMERADTWDTQEVHKTTSLVISQTQALLIKFDDIMNAIKP